MLDSVSKLEIFSCAFHFSDSLTNLTLFFFVKIQDEESIIEVCTITISIVKQFLEDFEAELNSPGNPYLDKLFLLLVNLLQNDLSVDLFSRTYIILDILVEKFREPLFLFKGNSCCEKLSYYVLWHLNSKESRISELSKIVLSKLLKNNFETCKNVTRMTVQSQVAVAKLVGEGKLENSDKLQSCLEEISNKLFSDSNKKKTQNKLENINQNENEIIYSTDEDNLDTETERKLEDLPQKIISNLVVRPASDSLLDIENDTESKQVEDITSEPSNENQSEESQNENVSENVSENEPKESEIASETDSEIANEKEAPELQNEDENVSEITSENEPKESEIISENSNENESKESELKRLSDRSNSVKNLKQLLENNNAEPKPKWEAGNIRSNSSDLNTTSNSSENIVKKSVSIDSFPPIIIPSRTPLKLDKNLPLAVSFEMLESFNDDESHEFERQTQVLVSKISSLLNLTNKIAKTQDPEMLSDFYYEISNNYFDSPNLRITWLQNLSGVQRNNGNWVEAAQCKIHCAFLISEYLKKEKKFPKNIDLTKVAPNVNSELGLPSTDVEEGQFQADIFNLKTVVSCIDNAAKMAKQDSVSLFLTVNFLKKGGLFELAIDLYEIISNLQKTDKNYDGMIKSLGDCRITAEILTKKISDNETRLFASYYRVFFYGKELGEELHGQEFVYKKSASMKLGAFQNQIRALMNQTIPEDKIKSLNNSQIVDPESLDPNFCYYQIISVEQFHENKNRVTPYEKHFNCNHFIAQMAFSQEKKQQQEDLSKQQKKKIIFITEMPYPYMKCNLKVIDKKDIIITPIENAIEIIQGQSASLREQLESTPRLNALQQVIQGSVVPMVNAGPLEICKVFLGGENNYPKEDVLKLSSAMQEFINLCAFAIKLNKSLITPKYLKFQEMVEQHYQNLRKEVRKHTENHTHVRSLSNE